MREGGWRHLARRHDDARAHLGPAIHLHRERHRHSDTAMRRRIARQYAGMHRNTRPRDPLHERHRCAAVDVGMMQLLLLDHAEGAHRRQMAGHAGRNRRFREEAVGVVYPEILPVERDRDDQRSLRLGGFLCRCCHLFRSAAAGPLHLLRRNRCRPRISSVIVRPEHGGLCLRHQANRSGHRQSGNLPKSMC